ncbi:MAG: hypothetical protein LYZ69_03130 [Nitrososphaerales archaeon]|nr:hypothetical protein [Nitrososphaerales archaeon]
MSDISWLFGYTPLPWLVAMYVVAYRHDLSRIRSPLRDHANQAEWWSVCRHLGLIDGSVKMPADDPGRWTWLAILACGVTSGLWAIIPFPFTWYALIALRVAAAFPLFLVLVRNFGPLSYKPYRDFLPYPRRGTRVRHLEQAKRHSGEKHNALAVREGGGEKSP